MAYCIDVSIFCIVFRVLKKGVLSTRRSTAQSTTATHNRLAPEKQRNNGRGAGGFDCRASCSTSDVKTTVIGTRGRHRELSRCCGRSSRRLHVGMHRDRGRPGACISRNQALACAQWKRYERDIEGGGERERERERLAERQRS